MQEMSLIQTRELHDGKIGEAMRQVQDCRTLAEEYGKICIVRAHDIS